MAVVLEQTILEALDVVPMPVETPDALSAPTRSVEPCAQRQWSCEGLATAALSESARGCGPSSAEARPEVDSWVNSAMPLAFTKISSIARWRIILHAALSFSRKRAWSTDAFLQDVLIA